MSKGGDGEGFRKKLWRLLLAGATGETKREEPPDIEVVDPFERLERAIRKESESEGE